MSDVTYKIATDGQIKEKLDLLDAIQHEEEHTQRSLAARMGTALGLTNALVKKCARKGLIKIKEAPARRYAYYITPDGFREKSRLVGEYLNASLDFFRHARSEYDVTIEMCLARGWSRIVLVGAGELAEIATLSAQKDGIEFIALLDEGSNKKFFLGIPVVQHLRDLEGIQAVIIADQAIPQETYERLIKFIPEQRLLAPPLLRVQRRLSGEQKVVST